MTETETFEVDLDTYEAETYGVRVRVSPLYLEDESSPEDEEYLWAYRVEIHNGSSITLQLQERFWTITDGIGRSQEVAGRGVVGQEPTIAPGEVFEYASGCPLNTPSGIMFGHYVMVDDGGEHYQVAIPPFSLDSPHETARLH